MTDINKKIKNNFKKPTRDLKTVLKELEHVHPDATFIIQKNRKNNSPLFFEVSKDFYIRHLTEGVFPLEDKPKTSFEPDKHNDVQGVTPDFAYNYMKGILGPETWIYKTLQQVDINDNPIESTWDKLQKRLEQSDSQEEYNSIILWFYRTLDKQK